MKNAVMVLCLLLCCVPWVPAAEMDMEATLETRAAQAQEAMRLCLRYANGWLAHCDVETGLMPRNITRDPHWNAKDAAADNYPFLAMTAVVSGQYHLERAALHILEQEQRITNRLGELPDTWDFRTQQFLEETPKAPDIIFGASEYVKDGLMPLVEWTGPGPWLDRMEMLVRGLWALAEETIPPETRPLDNIEVCGELMQSMSRLYRRTGDAWYKERCYLLADRYLLEKPLTKLDRIPLRDHGCEIIGGLSETYAIAAQEDPERHALYRAPMYALLDLILEMGVNEDGLMPSAFHPNTGEQDWKRISDGWGYVYNAFLTVAEADNEPRYRDAVLHALNNIHKYLGADWENGSADGYADSVEGALNLLNHLPVASAFRWVDESMWHIFAKQRADGIVEGWHGDGNSARTSLMYALWKTQGLSLRPWREDTRLAAALDDAGALHVMVAADWQWNGQVRFDRPRHKDYLNLPLDYPRINQMPEWFTAVAGKQYRVAFKDGDAQTLDGEALWTLPLSLEPGQRVYFTVTPLDGTASAPAPDAATWRRFAYRPCDAAGAREWQEQVRGELAALLHIALAPETRREWPLAVETVASENAASYILTEITLNTTPDHRMNAVVTLPVGHGDGPFPAVVCIHGHGGTRRSVYETDSIYHGVAAHLAGLGVATIAVDVGQHDLRDPNATLMGERLLDLIRCVDYLETLPQVDATRIGCAGLSLGGEMAMWLGAMDTRIRATVSSGFLTFMDQMERNHCMCWKFDGLRERVDFADIYALVAPRALLCQIGEKEPLSQFNTVLAQRAFTQLQQIFHDMNAGTQARLEIHDGAHEVHLPTLTAFLLGHLAAMP